MRSFRVCGFYPILLGLLYKEDVIDRSCSMYGDKLKHKILVRRFVEETVCDLGVAGGIMLLFIVEVL